MPETCGCKANRKLTRAEQAGLDRWEEPDDVIFCPLHARAAEMRELLNHYRTAHDFDIKGQTGDGPNCGCPICDKARALLEATR